MRDAEVYAVGKENAGVRADVFVSECAGLTRSAAQKLIEDGLVTAGGQPIAKNRKLSEGDEITVTFPEIKDLNVEPEDIPLDVVYEDDDIIIVNKPAGMVVHPAPGHERGTLVGALLNHCKGSLSSINGVARPGIVHRIDRDTTGSVIICKNDAAHSSIAQQLKEHTIVRRYYAIAYDNIAEDSFTVDQPLGRDLKDRKRMAVRPDGKRAVTHGQVLRRFGKYTYVECRLETGRTHQIRVHMAYIHHPLVGDEVYAGKRQSPFATQGQCLHAGVLGFVHPRTGQYIETHAPLPEYFQRILAKIQ